MVSMLRLLGRNTGRASGAALRVVPDGGAMSPST